MSQSSFIVSQPNLNSGLQNPAVVVDPSPARDVLRCSRCMLVQFRTASGLCRRCDQPLPRPPSEIAMAVPDPAPQAMPAAAVDSPAGDFEPLEVRGKTLPSFALGPRLRDLRESRNFTQAQIARKARVPRTYVSRIEHCHLLPGLGVVERLAEALEVELLELLPNQNSSAAPVVSNDPYWNALVRYFRLLQDEQRARVLAQVRAMLGHQPIGSAA